METIQQFINRNKGSYKKQNSVPKEFIQKYNQMFKGEFPKEILWIWEHMGFGIYEDGFLQLVNPEEYEFVFDYIDKRLEPTIVFGITALGDVLIWEGNENWTIAPDEGNRFSMINIKKLNKNILGSKIRVHLNILMNDEEDLEDKEMYDAKAYLDIKDKLPKLEYGQCYGYTPALPLGGKAKNENLEVVDTKSYINIIGQAVGKIYSKD
ncbi:DUF1851 domain-containing protein [Cellulophaga lytica]|uniref:T6SS immunity protein Tdi1 domain-containing protein n=1 Tax=Cellulophaga lytica TaxID=979 RepID=UPI0026E3E8D6|nr:T6SS immunity protein Tdi1 domain-containing protein [Cellulophaga lytica]MDO6853843.1 DUF1851 domain-containing protein [Cellulophaga lytica]